MNEVIDNVIDEKYCERVIEKLIYQGSWNFATDYDDPRYKGKQIENSDNGLLFVTYIRDEGIDYHEFNLIAEEILVKFLERSSWEYGGIEICRYFFNYYNRGSDGVYHEDHPEPNHQTVLVNLNTNDGGTIIEEEFVKSEAGRCIGFDSIMTHKGVGPTESKQRFALNIVFAYAYKKRKLKT